MQILAAASSSSVAINNSTVSFNAANSNGAAINCVSTTSTISFTNSKATSNVSLSEGGVVFMSMSSTALGPGLIQTSNSTFTYNVATSGGVFRAGGRVDANLTTSIFQNNLATSSSGGGGALHSSGIGVYNFTADTCTFENNVADGGGAINFASVTVTFAASDCVFRNNTATGASGGAIRDNATTATITLTRSTFSENSALTNAGAIDIASGVANINSSTFYKNTAGSNGGAYNLRPRR